MDAQPLTPEQAQSLLASLTPESLGALIAALGLSADQVTPETILSAVQSLAEKAGQVDTLNAQLSELQAADTARQQDELNEQLNGYDLGDDVAAVVRGLPADQRTALLSKLPKKAAAAAVAEPAAAAAAATRTGSSVVKPPPAPIHNPKAQAASDTPEARAKAAADLINKIKAGGKFTSYEAARAEARRQQPSLFA